MKLKNLKKFLKHELIKGSVLIFAGSLFANFFNYLFHLITGRMLGPANYAIIASLISLFYIISFPSSIINTIVTRKVAALSAKNDFPSIAGVFRFLLKNVFYFNLALFFIFLLFKSQIANFLKIKDSFLVFLLGLSFIFTLFTIVSLATLQGLLRFFSFSLLITFSSLLRDILAILVILLGFGVLGVTWAMVLTGFLSFLASFYPLRDILRVKEKVRKFHLSSYLSTSWVAAALLGMGLMLNSDVMLVKHFFSEYQAGLYAALATMGKIVFFACSSVGTVLLPLVTKKRERGEGAAREFSLSQALVFSASLFITLIYLLLPKQVINIFYGKSYLPLSQYLWLIALYFLFYNLSSLFVNFLISLRKKEILLTPLIFAFLQISLIFLFHKSLFQILLVLILTSCLLFFTFALYYLRYEKIRI